MGLLSEGRQLTWEEIKDSSLEVRKRGITQFLNQHDRHKTRNSDPFTWGDEIEYMLVKLDDDTKSAKLCLKAATLLDSLKREKALGKRNVAGDWHPEFCEFMVEGIPKRPFTASLKQLCEVEKNMIRRRTELKYHLDDDEYPVTMTTFPRFGCNDFTFPNTKPTPEFGTMKSAFVSDQVLCQSHHRFKTLTECVRGRRGGNPVITEPVYRDKCTKIPFYDEQPGAERNNEKVNKIQMDSTAFGFGSCCLQVTFQASSLFDAMNLYDQLTTLTPILLALSAASPIKKGYLSDIDVRLSVLTQATDDRTDDEKDAHRLENRVFYPRSDAVRTYLTSEIHNDIDINFDEDLIHQMTQEDVDVLLAKHIAHLFTRDPLSISSDILEHSSENDTDCFESINSTNWQTMRFKIPPPNGEIGWRVEFRPMEIQLTDFENAAYAIFVILLARTIQYFGLDLLIPMSRVRENYARSLKRDAVLKERFYTKRNIFGEYQTCDDTENQNREEECNLVEDVDEMDIDEIINGSDTYPGLISLIYKYMETEEPDDDTKSTIQRYLNLISRRASGNLKTTSRWIRDFVARHPDYERDSRVPNSVNFDLVKECIKRKGEEFDSSWYKRINC